MIPKEIKAPGWYGAPLLLGDSVCLIMDLFRHLMNSRKSIPLDSWLRKKLHCLHPLQSLNSTLQNLMFRWCYHQMLFIGFNFWWSVLQYDWLSGTCVLILLGPLFLLFVSWVFSFMVFVSLAKFHICYTNTTGSSALLGSAIRKINFRKSIPSPLWVVHWSTPLLNPPWNWRSSQNYALLLWTRHTIYF